MTGYQEILTDPSYYEQIITMTYPLIGNYGTNKLDWESGKIYAAGFIVSKGLLATSLSGIDDSIASTCFRICSICGFRSLKSRAVFFSRSSI